MGSGMGRLIEMQHTDRLGADRLTALAAASYAGSADGSI